MSDPDDRAFDVYLARGSNLSQRYRNEATDKPSAALDALILTASRRAKVSLSEIPVQPWYKRWRVPLAFAAVLLLGVGVTLRTVLQESKLGEPPPVAPAAKYESVPAPATTAPPAEPADSTAPVPSEPAAVVEGGALSTPADAGAATGNELGQQKSNQSEEIIIEQETPESFPAAPSPMPEDKAAAAKPSPAPNGGVAPGEDDLGSPAGRGSSGTALDEARSERRIEQDTQTDKAVSETQQPDSDVLARRRDQVTPEMNQEPAPPAVVPEPLPDEADSAAAVKQTEILGDGPRLPPGNPPIVDGKTFRADSARRQAEEQEKARAAAATVADAAETPEAWLRRIAELRRLGSDEEANAELDRFRKRYPDYPAPLEK